VTTLLSEATSTVSPTLIGCSMSIMMPDTKFNIIGRSAKPTPTDRPPSMSLRLVRSTPIM
jgi:hypothetical protein